MTATKPLKPKNIYSQFSIARFIREYNLPEYLIISQDLFLKFKGKTSKHAKNKFRKRYPHQKILTVKKINKQK